MRLIDADALLEKLDDLYPPAPGALAVVGEICKIIREAPTVKTDGGKVYLITSGWYSDYHIIAVFSNQEDAKHFTKLHNAAHGIHDQADIEVYELNSVRDCEPLMIVYNTDRDSCLSFEKGEGDYHVVDRDMLYTVENQGEVNHLFVFMLEAGENLCTDYEKIMKIAQDRWAAYRAMKEGI